MSDTVESQPVATEHAAGAALGLSAAVALLQHNPEPIALCDAGAHIVWCNRRLLELCGGAPAEGRGQPLAALLNLPAEDAALLEQALSQGRPGPLPEMTFAHAIALVELHHDRAFGQFLPRFVCGELRGGDVQLCGEVI